jgi:hypothetical protein
VITAATAGAIISLSFVYKAWVKYRHQDPYATPEALLDILDEDTCLYLGSRYLALYPAENKADILKAKMLSASKGDAASHYFGFAATEKVISDTIFREFSLSAMVLIDGWMLSHTEARQCALFYLNQQKS